MSYKAFTQYVEKHKEKILEVERYVWQHPESGFRERNTSKYLAKIFEEAGYTLTYAKDIPGFYTDIETGKPGPGVLILGEMDALLCPNHPEQTNGCAHACGHNAQCAALVDIALASGALALGAEVISEDRPGHSPLINDTALCKLMADVAEEILGKDSVKRTTTWGYGTTDMGDLTCVMRACHPYISGAVGHGHGDDYFITDPECSCVISADIYMMTVRALLENGAEKATAIMNGPELRYPNKEAFFAEIDKLMADRDMVKYTDNGAEICFV